MRPVRKLILSTPGKARETLSKLVREVHKSEPDDLDLGRHKLLLAYFEEILRFWRLEKDVQIEARLDALESKLLEQHRFGQSNRQLQEATR